MNVVQSAAFEIDIVERINLLEREVAGQGAKLDAIKDSINRLASNVDRPTNWIGVGALVCTMFGVTMAFLSLVTSGVQTQVASNSELLRIISPKVYEGQVLLNDQVERQDETERDIKKLMVQMGMLDGFLKFEGQRK